MPGHAPPVALQGVREATRRGEEKLIKDNQLCPFCLLHDKDKPCGAKQKPAACIASSCKGKHIQKLLDFLKNVFEKKTRST